MSLLLPRDSRMTRLSSQGRALRNVRSSITLDIFVTDVPESTAPACGELHTANVLQTWVLKFYLKKEILTKPYDIVLMSKTMNASATLFVALFASGKRKRGSPPSSAHKSWSKQKAARINPHWFVWNQLWRSSSDASWGQCWERWLGCASKIWTLCEWWFAHLVQRHNVSSICAPLFCSVISAQLKQMMLSVEK